MQASQPVVLPRTTVTASAVAHLREEIVAGRLGPGEALAEARVGELLGVSRAPVREALTLLEQEGLVAFDRRGTARVCTFGPADVRELGLLRLALEPVAARLVCERRPPPALQALADNLRQLRRAGTLDEVTRLDLEFHHLIMQASANRRLAAAWESLAAQFRLVMTRFHRCEQRRTRRVRESTHRRHTELFAGLKGGDPARVESLARDHATEWIGELDKRDAFEEPAEAVS